MASKFMAFESVASTSSASLEHDGAGERIEMNSNQYPNYQTNQMASTSNAYGAVNAEAAEEDDLNDNFEEKTEQDVGYRKFLYNNSEQFKSILGGEFYNYFQSEKYLKKIKISEKKLLIERISIFSLKKWLVSRTEERNDNI